MKLQGKMLIPLLLVFVASIAVVVGTIVFQQSRVIRRDVIQLSREIANTESKKLATLLDKAYYISDAMARTLEEYRGIDAGNKREFALRSLKGALASNPDFIGTWACFEPGAFVGMDAEYANTSPFT